MVTPLTLCLSQEQEAPPSQLSLTLAAARDPAPCRARVSPVPGLARHAVVTVKLTQHLEQSQSLFPFPSCCPWRGLGQTQEHGCPWVSDVEVLKVERIQLIDAVLNLCTYHHPENIQLPPG